MSFPSRIIVLFCLALAYTCAGAECYASVLRMQSGTFDPLATVRLESRPDADTVAPQFHIIQFESSITPADRELILRTGADILGYIPDNALLIQASENTVQAVSRHPRVRWTGPYQKAFKVSKSLGNSFGKAGILLFPGSDIKKVTDRLEAEGVAVLDADANSNDPLLVVEGDGAQIRALAQIGEIRFIEPIVQPRLLNNVARGITRITPVWLESGLTGQGEIVGVSDSGLDIGATNPMVHPDVRGRVEAAFGLGRPGLTNDPDGHGTHVAGTILGNGIMSGANPAAGDYAQSFAGAAPEARLVMQSVLDAAGGLGGLPGNLNALYQQAYDAGARLHNNSWGAPVSGAYTIFSRQTDEFHWFNKDFLAFFAAGNSGKDGNADGVVDPGSIESPGTAKNVLTVGASESVRTTGGLQVRYGIGGWSSLFPAEPIRSDWISDNHRGIAGWSSRGPTTDGRLKPDIVAPGTNIISLRSRDSQAGVNWGVYDAHYTYSGGTSMATPLAAGAGALVRQYFNQQENHSPTSALVKATLIATAQDLTPGQYGSGPTQEISGWPDRSQGWGLLDPKAALAPAAPEGFQYFDQKTGLETGEIAYHETLVTSAALPLRVALVWTDFPGDVSAAKALVNDLDLQVTDPNGVIYGPVGGLDRLNNVEAVRISNPVPGRYTIRVLAHSVPIGPQPYALAITGALPDARVKGSVTTGTGNPVPGVSVTLVSESTHIVATTSADGRFAASLTPGNWQAVPERTGWTFIPSEVTFNIEAASVYSLNFTASAPPASLGGTVTTEIRQQFAGVWESPHPYANNQDITTVIQGPQGAARMRVYFERVSVESGFDFVYLRGSDGQAFGVFSGELLGFWSPWVPGNLLAINLVSDTSITGYGWKATAYEASLPGNALPGAEVRSSLTGSVAVTGTSGAYLLAGQEPLATTLTAGKPGWEILPFGIKVLPEPGQAVENLNFVAVPEIPRARIRIQHTFIGDLTVRVGVGSPTDPVWQQVIANRQGGADQTLEVEVALEGTSQYFPPTADRPWYFRVCDNEAFDEGQIVEAWVRMGGVTYSSVDLPAQIRDFQCTDVLIPANNWVNTGAAKSLADGTSVVLGAKVVSTVLPGRFYIQEPDRSSGIAVIGSFNTQPGDLLTVKGILATISEERVLLLGSASVNKSPGTPPRALGAKALDYRPGSTGVDGLLIRLAGRVEPMEGGMIQVVDGSGEGVVIVSPSTPVVSAGDFITIKGAAGRVAVGGESRKAIYIPNSTSLTIESQAP